MRCLHIAGAGRGSTSCWRRSRLPSCCRFRLSLLRAVRCRRVHAEKEALETEELERSSQCGRCCSSSPPRLRGPSTTANRLQGPLSREVSSSCSQHLRIEWLFSSMPHQCRHFGLLKLAKLANSPSTWRRRRQRQLRDSLCYHRHMPR